MRTPTLNGSPITRACLVMPRVGAWTADIELDEVVAPMGVLTLVIGDLTLVGAVVRFGQWHGGTLARLVGGVGGLGNELQAKAYRNTPYRIPLQDALTAAGEALDASSDAGALAGVVGHWIRPTGPAGASVTLLADAMGVSWRVQPSGAIRFASETWPTASIGPYEVLGESPEHDRAELGVDVPALLPGTVLSGRRVSVAEHHVSPDRIRTVAWFEP